MDTHTQPYRDSNTNSDADARTQPDADSDARAAQRDGAAGEGQCGDGGAHQL
jgi:hypothetical protein